MSDDDEPEWGFSEVVVDWSERWSWLTPVIAFFDAVAEFCHTIAHSLSSHHQWSAEQREFHDDVRAEIEKIPTAEG